MFTPPTLMLLSVCTAGSKGMSNSIVEPWLNENTFVAVLKLCCVLPFLTFTVPVFEALSGSCFWMKVTLHVLLMVDH